MTHLFTTSVSVSVEEEPYIVSVASVHPIDCHYELGPSRDVRNSIIALVRRLHSHDSFCAPFVAHLQKIGRHRLDGFSELEFLLKEHRVRLVFRTSQMEVNEMTYTLPNLRLPPDARLQEKPGMVARLLGLGGGRR